MLVAICHGEAVQNAAAAISDIGFGSCARQHFCLFSLRCSPENTSHRTSIQTLFCILSSPPCSLTGTHNPQQIHAIVQKTPLEHSKAYICPETARGPCPFLQGPSDLIHWTLGQQKKKPLKHPHQSPHPT